MGRPRRGKVPTANNGGTTYPGKPKVPKANTSALTTPPAFTFDPALAAKQREATLKEEQNLEDLKSRNHFAETDLHTALHNLNTSNKREYQKLGLESQRGNQRLDREKQGGEEKLGNEEADTKKNAQRQTEDFATKRKEIGRQFGDLAQRQAEAQNAGGTLDQGTSSAAAAARARNQRLAEAPIATGEARLGEDLATALGRISTARGKLGSEVDRERGELGEDVMTQFGQFNQDQTQKEHEARQQLGRELFGTHREGQRTKLAGVNARQNYLEEEIYQAMEEHPGEFKKWAEENPGVLPAGVTPKGIEKPGAAGQRANAAGDRAKKAVGTLNRNGGTPYPGKKKKGGR